MKHALLIGVGNTLRGDDAVGIRVAERARSRFPQLDVLCAHGLSPELADTVAQYDLLLIVDASLTAASLQVSAVIPASSGAKIQAHTMTPAGLLGLAAALYEHTPSKSVLIEVPVVTCEFSEDLSPSVAAHVEACLDVVETFLAGS
jgi:hydrogenase maturation protease